MDTKIPSVNYQPTGVYAQFSNNPALLNQAAIKKQEQEAALHSKKNEIPLSAKIGKHAKRLGIVAGVAAIGYGIYQYSKGMKAIKLKEKIFPNVTEDSIERWMNRQFSDEQREFYQTTWNEGNQYLKGRVGKIHNGIQSVRNWFKEYFFNY